MNPGEMVQLTNKYRIFQEWLRPKRSKQAMNFVLQQFVAIQRDCHLVAKDLSKLGSQAMHGGFDCPFRHSQSLGRFSVGAVAALRQEKSL